MIAIFKRFRSVPPLKHGLFFALLSGLLLAGIAAGEEVKITLFQTTDIHANLLEEKDGVTTGWLALAPVIRKERRLAGGETASVLIDCGDSLQGSIIGTLTRGRIAVDLLNALHYDVWVIGNHDFEFGPENLVKSVQALKPAVLAANLSLPVAAPIKAWVMLNKKGAKLAVLGLTAPPLDEWLWGNNFRGIRAASLDSALDRLLPAVMKAEPDMIILAVHYGEFPGPVPEENNIRRLAAKYPQINLILGGHTHQAEAGKKVGPATWYTQAGKHGEYLVKIEALIDTTRHRLVTINSQLLPAAGRTELKVEKKFAAYLAQEGKYGQKSIGVTNVEIAAAGEQEQFSAMSELIGRSIAAKTGVTAVFHGPVSHYGLFRGKITERSLFNALPFEDSIGILELAPAEFRLVLAEQLAQQSKGRFQSPWGVYAHLEAAAKIGRLTFPDGKEWQDSKTIKVAFNSYVLAGAGGRFPLLKKLAADQRYRPIDTGLPVRDAVRDYISTHSPLREITPVAWIRKD